MEMAKKQKNEYYLTCGMEAKAGKIRKDVADKLDLLIEMYEKGMITKSTLVVDINEFFHKIYDIKDEVS